MGMNLGTATLVSFRKRFRGTGEKVEGRRRNTGINKGSSNRKGATWLPLSPELLPKPISKNTSNSMDSPLPGWSGVGGCDDKGHRAPRDATEHEFA